MAATNTTDNGAIRKLVILCVTLTAALNVPVFYVLAEHANEMAEIRTSILVRTSDRYYLSDHMRYKDSHEKLAAVQLRNIYFRFERNEEQIKFCVNEIRKLKE